MQVLENIIFDGKSWFKKLVLMILQGGLTYSRAKISRQCFPLYARPTLLNETWTIHWRGSMLDYMLGGRRRGQSMHRQLDASYMLEADTRLLENL